MAEAEAVEHHDYEAGPIRRGGTKLLRICLSRYPNGNPGVHTFDDVTFICVENDKLSDYTYAHPSNLSLDFRLDGIITHMTLWSIPTPSHSITTTRQDLQGVAYLLRKFV